MVEVVAEELGRVALTIELTRTCDHGGAVETATDQPGTQRFDERIRDGSSYRDRRFYLLVSLADRGAYAGDRNLRRWDLASGREINPSPTWRRRLRGPDLRSSMSSPNQIRPLAITTDGNRAVSALAEGLHVWDLRSDGAPRILSDSMQEEAIAALPGQRVLAPESYNAARLLVWDLDAGRAVGELLGHVGGVSTLAVSADGRRAVSAGRDFVIYLWDLTALTPIATFTIEDFPIICALTAHGDTAVVGDRRTLHLLRLEDGNPTA